MRYEWGVAWRYLRRRDRGSRVPIIIAAILLACGAILAVASAVADRFAIELAFRGASDVPLYLKYGATGCVALGTILGVFGAFNLVYAVFTALSITGVFLGTAAMVIFLSVMSGFEGDLKTKILGANAHVIVNKESGAFLQDDPKVRDLAELEAGTRMSPFLSSEVMILSASNQAGALLKGIEPGTITKVTDLDRWLQRRESSGSLDYLQGPEKLRDLGLPPLPRLDGSSSEFATRRPPSQPASRAAPPGGASASAPRPGPASVPAGARPGPASDRALGRPTSAPAHADERPASRPIAEGRLGAADAPARRLLPGILIGREMAKNLRLFVGDDVNVVCPMCGIGPTGPIAKSKPFRVAGIFYSGMYEYDAKHAYVLLPQAQKFLEMEGEITGLEIKVRDFQRADLLANTMRQRLGPTYEVKDWKELNRSLFSALYIEKITMFIILAMIVAVAGLCIISTLIMLVTARAREIAILKSMGARDGSVLSIFLMEGAYIGGQGMIIGVLSGIAGCLALRSLDLKADVYYISKLPVQLQPLEIMVISLAALLISLLFTAYPAYVASRMQPVAGLRYE
ncbi:MAG: FtsX-like permease family protein [Deltaproteobacteria bacterium]|nr:FtsX-like permease family protein [Deltaproteobacteria bacterium]